MRDADHELQAQRYAEKNPVKAGLWPRQKIGHGVVPDFAINIADAYETARANVTERGTSRPAAR